jgi:hypothetical protein
MPPRSYVPGWNRLRGSPALSHLIAWLTDPRLSVKGHVRPSPASLSRVVVSALLLSGCITLGPDFETPESRRLEAEDERVKAVPADTLESWKW